MFDILLPLMRWLHLCSVATLAGGILYALLVVSPSENVLTPEAREKFQERAAAQFRPIVFGAICCLLVSGLFNFLTKAPHMALYHALFGIKILLALHVFATAILVARPGNKRRNRQMLGAAISAVSIILISNFLKGLV